jgi:hypothetical protein
MAPDVGLGTQGSVQRGWGLWLTSVLAVVIAGLFVGARFGQRIVKRSGIGWDDYMIVAALISSGLLSLTECQGIYPLSASGALLTASAVVYGYGRHWTTLPSDSRMAARKWFYGANIVYKIVLMFNKISVVCLYYRIFGVSTKSFRIVCYVMNAWIFASGMAFIIATVFQCTPIAAFWDRSIRGFKCFKNEPWWISYATVQITTDFMLLAMPIRQIVHLSMGKAEKLGIALVFGTGALYVFHTPLQSALTHDSVTFASIYRATTIAASASDTDPTWGPIPATIWSVIEANAGIVCACLPMLRGPFVRLFGPLFGSRRRTSKRQSYSLTVRSGQPNAVAVVGNSRRAPSDTNISFDSDSEKGIMKDNNIATISEGKIYPRGRRESQILVTNEFSVVTDELAQRKSPNGSEGQEATVAEMVSEDKLEGKRPFFHI